LITPVLFLVFNRLETTRRVFEAIRQAKPPRLYIAADGPRSHRPEESARVKEVRDHILNSVDWPCDVKTLFREENLGCGKAVAGGISWFFEHEDQGIILEDDCLPSPSFFPFCEVLLEQFADDRSVAGITGDFRPVDGGQAPDRYGRIRYPLIWGWASWRRVWKLYDPTMAGWKGDATSLARLAKAPHATQRYFEHEFGRTKRGELDTWDYQFTHTVLKQGLDFIHPHVNLISNLGFAGPATNTSDPEDPNAELPLGSVRFPLRPADDGSDYSAWLDAHVFAAETLPSKVIRRVSKWVRDSRPRS
jgi:hypothetical protein